jgi:hypothetical protein
MPEVREQTRFKGFKPLRQFKPFFPTTLVHFTPRSDNAGVEEHIENVVCPNAFVRTAEGRANVPLCGYSRYLSGFLWYIV